MTRAPANFSGRRVISCALPPAPSPDTRRCSSKLVDRGPVNVVLLGDQRFALAGREAPPERHRPQHGVEFVGGVLDDIGRSRSGRRWTDRDVPARGSWLPSRHTSDTSSPLLDAGEHPSRFRSVGHSPAARGQPWRAQPGAPVDLRRCARPAIQSRRAGDRSAVDEGISDRPPTHIRVDPMDRRRREHRPKVRPRQRRLLQAGVDELRALVPATRAHARAMSCSPRSTAGTEPRSTDCASAVPFHSRTPERQIRGDVLSRRRGRRAHPDTSNGSGRTRRRSH